MRKIIFLVNPIAGTKSKSKLPGIIAKSMNEHSIFFEIMETKQHGDYSYLEEKIVSEKFTDVVVCGGDGTVNQVVCSIAKTGIRFGIIPMGSGNGLALAAKIPRHVQKALDIVVAGHSQKVDAFLVNNEFACMLCGLGLDAAVAHAFANDGKRGLVTYARLATQNFFRAPLYNFEISTDQHSFSTEAYFISIANSNQFGNHFTIAPQASLADGLLDIVVVQRSLKPLMVWHVLLQILRGKISPVDSKRREAIKYFQTRELKISNPNLAPLHIDGEPRKSQTNLSIEVLPSYFALIQP